ncbi:MAG: twin-arginine translocation signal domain-containing protein [Acidobacteria bacterium]|nr:MAG: twin-arginine translocation signal domain-containing protein [Acidobacteriota bacterium]
MSNKRKRELGQNKPITRRDFIHGSTAMLGAALTSSSCGVPSEVPPTEESSAADYSFDVDEAWYGPGGVGDYASSHGNTPSCSGSTVPSPSPT